MPYLTRSEVTATVQAIGDLSAPGSRLVVNYQAPALSARLGRLTVRALTTAGAAARSAGGRTQPVCLEARTAELGCSAGTVTSSAPTSTCCSSLASSDVEVRHRRSLRNGRVLVADRG